MKYFIVCALVLCGVIQKAQAYSCTTLIPTTTINTPNITISKSLPVGSEIGSTSTGVLSIYRCENTAPILTYQAFGVKGVGTYVTDIDSKRIYSTGIKGIGYAIEGYTYGCGNDVYSGWVGMGSNLDGNPNNRGLCAYNGIIASQPVPGSIRIAYYKIDQITGSGTVSPGTVASFILQNDQSSWHLPESYVNLSSLTVTTIPCEVNQTVINVPMGDIERKEFKGVGTSPSATNTRNFTIPLTCNPEAKVNVQIDGNIQNAEQGVLSLTESSDSASGVGIQLLFNNTPVKLGSPLYIGTTSIDGLYDIPLQARYYQTAAPIKTGTANATATFTITYQ